MNLITWSSAFIINVKRSDEQHERLVHLLNKLNAACKEEKSCDELHLIFTSLAYQVVVHLSDEENILLSNGYKDLAEQKSEEAKIISQSLLELLKQLQPGKVFTVSKLVLLKDWLLKHILDDGRQYGPYLDNGIVKSIANSRQKLSVMA